MNNVKQQFSKRKWLAIAIATLALSVLLSFVSPAFMSLTNIQSIFVQASVTSIMAVGMTFIIIAGGIDISMGAILFFVSSIFAKVLASTGSYSVALGSALTCACILGLINGVLVIRFKITPLITTLATYTIYRGMAIHLTEAQNIPVPRELGYLGNGTFLGLPVPILLMLIIVVLGVYLLSFTRFGVYVRAIGNSARSARESNLPIARVTVATYLMGGFCAAIAGLILVARVGGLQSGIGIGIEFTVIAAVILGGTRLIGGSGSVVGSVIGAVFLVLIDNGLNLMNVSPYIYDTVRGMVLLIAVGLDRFALVRQALAVKTRNAERIQQSY